MPGVWQRAWVLGSPALARAAGSWVGCRRHLQLGSSQALPIQAEVLECVSCIKSGCEGIHRLGFEL